MVRVNLPSGPRDVKLIAGINSKILCGRCGSLSLDPYLMNCGTVLCPRCLGKYSSISPCPCGSLQCGNPFSFRMFEEQVMNLMVECPNHIHGCSSMVSMRYLDQHLEVCKCQSLAPPTGIEPDVFETVLDLTDTVSVAVNLGMDRDVLMDDAMLLWLEEHLQSKPLISPQPSPMVITHVESLRDVIQMPREPECQPELTVQEPETQSTLPSSPSLSRPESRQQEARSPKVLSPPKPKSESASPEPELHSEPPQLNDVIQTELAPPKTELQAEIPVPESESELPPSEPRSEPLASEDVPIMDQGPPATETQLQTTTTPEPESSSEVPQQKPKTQKPRSRSTSLARTEPSSPEPPFLSDESDDQDDTDPRTERSSQRRKYPRAKKTREGDGLFVDEGVLRLLETGVPGRTRGLRQDCHEDSLSEEESTPQKLLRVRPCSLVVERLSDEIILKYLKVAAATSSTSAASSQAAPSTSGSSVSAPKPRGRPSIYGHQHNTARKSTAFGERKGEKHLKRTQRGSPPTIPTAKRKFQATPRKPSAAGDAKAASGDQNDGGGDALYSSRTDDSSDSDTARQGPPAKNARVAPEPRSRAQSLGRRVNSTPLDDNQPQQGSGATGQPKPRSKSLGRPQASRRSYEADEDWLTASKRRSVSVKRKRDPSRSATPRRPRKVHSISSSHTEDNTDEDKANGGTGENNSESRRARSRLVTPRKKNLRVVYSSDTDQEPDNDTVAAPKVAETAKPSVRRARSRTRRVPLNEETENTPKCTNGTSASVDTTVDSAEKLSKASTEKPQTRPAEATSESKQRPVLKPQVSQSPAQQTTNVPKPDEKAQQKGGSFMRDPRLSLHSSLLPKRDLIRPVAARPTQASPSTSRPNSSTGRQDPRTAARPKTTDSSSDNSNKPGSSLQRPQAITSGAKGFPAQRFPPHVRTSIESPASGSTSPATPDLTENPGTNLPSNSSSARTIAPLQRYPNQSKMAPSAGNTPSAFRQDQLRSPDGTTTFNGNGPAQRPSSSPWRSTHTDTQASRTPTRRDSTDAERRSQSEPGLPGPSTPLIPLEPLLPRLPQRGGISERRPRTEFMDLPALNWSDGAVPPTQTSTANSSRTSQSPQVRSASSDYLARPSASDAPIAEISTTQNGAVGVSTPNRQLPQARPSSRNQPAGPTPPTEGPVAMPPAGPSGARRPRGPHSPAMSGQSRYAQGRSDSRPRLQGRTGPGPPYRNSPPQRPPSRGGGPAHRSFGPPQQAPSSIQPWVNEGAWNYWGCYGR